MRRRKTRRKSRRRSRRRSTKSRARSGISRQWGKIATTLGGLAFFQQLTEKDMGALQNSPLDQKVKGFLNSVTGRLFGITPIDGPNKGIPQTINLGGIFNKWSGLGLGAWLYGQVPVSLPHKGKAKTLGKSLLTGGVLGGLFDAPDNQSMTWTGNQNHVLTVNTSQLKSTVS